MAQYTPPATSSTPQATDTTSVDNEDTKTPKQPFSWKHNPKVATLLSVAMPGAGQYYNKSYWKIPVFISVIGTFTYLAIDYHTRYTDYKEAFIYLVDKKGVSDLVEDPSEAYREQKFNEIYFRRPEIRKFNAINATDQERILAFRRDDARRSRDYMIIFAVLSYVCNLVDAAVDAHFTKFDVSDNLTMKIVPNIDANYALQPEAGFKLSASFINPRTKQYNKIDELK
ncbi:MAG: DUF5683 domain-containing protein [Cytophagales bacterium]|nr:DUF5683 domain-containing protein [Cytophagales bacterium]